MSMLDSPDFYCHPCVYWAPDGVDDNGQRTFAAPVQLCCRWVDTNETFIDKLGNVQEGKSKIRLPTDVNELGVLWKGKLKDLVSQDDPFANPSAWEIRKFTKTPDRHCRRCLRVAWV